MGVVIGIGILIILLIWVVLWLFWWGFTHLAIFLSLSQPIDADWLIVEGWLSDQSVKGASQEFFRGGYTGIITTGPPLTQGAFLAEYRTFADITKATLMVLGVPESAIISAPCLNAQRFRTGTAAFTVRAYLQQHQLQPQRGINLYTYGCHARRSFYVYRQVFGQTLPIGVIADPVQGFDCDRWWTTSLGVRTVISEFIAYLYGRLVRWHD